MKSISIMKLSLFACAALCSAMCMAQSTLTTPELPNPQDGQTVDLQSPLLNGLEPSKSTAGKPAKAILEQNTVPVLGHDKTPGFEHDVPPSTKFAGPITTKSEFQRFAEDTAGRPLEVYGRHLFDQVPTTFAPVDQIPVPADYVIGPGDEIVVRAWGKIELECTATVDRNGQISVPKVGTLNVAGLHYDQLESRLHSAVGSLYRDFEMSVTLGRLRSIQIYVLGSARQPGNYTVSSLSTLVNALFASGGPSATGSMRNIELRRGNQTVTALDLYDLLRRGDRSHDVQLMPADVIYIPPAGPQVAILGSVNEPGIYELKGDTSIESALTMAGGLTPLAGIDRILVEHIADHRDHLVDEFALNAAGLQRNIVDGDLLRVFPVTPHFSNAVTLRGNVAQPGRYRWHQGMRVSDIIPTRNSLITREYWTQQNHLFVPEPIQTTIHQTVETETNGTPTAASLERVSAEINGTAVAASVGKVSAEINWEYAVIERLDERDLSTHLIPFRLASAIDDPASSSNQVLLRDDIVTIFSRADLELPMDKHASFVRVGGEVNAPGVYRVDPGDTLQDVVRRSGGITSHAYLYAAKFTRVSTRRTQEEQIRQSGEQMQKELMSRYVNSAPMPGQSGTDQQAQFGIQQAAITRLASTEPTGRVILAMKPDAAAIEDIPALTLEDGDTFYIPPRLSTIQVTGSVYNTNAFRFQPGKRLIDYLNDAGGATREADKRRIFVIRADGIVISKQSRNSHLHEKFENLKLLPGDAIAVPARLKAPGGMRALQDLTQVISQSALTAAALNTVLP